MKKPLSAMGYWTGAFFIMLGIGIFVESNFIITISHDNFLWWEVIKTIQRSPFNLALAWIMAGISIVFMVLGVVIFIIADPKAQES